MRFLPIYLSLLFLCACYQTESSLPDSLVYCTDKTPSSFNPQISHDVATLDATTHQLYNRLIKVDPVSQRFIADIATHWTVSADKTEHTFYLRKDVNFHHTNYFTPTRKLNADDVLFSFKRMLSSEHPFHGVNIEAQSETYLYNHPFSNLVNDIVKIDEHTIRFLLNKPDATLLANLAAHYSVIHSQEYALALLAAGTPEQLDYLPIGSGPYQLKQSSNQRIIRYQAHRSPWQEAVHIDNLIFDVTPNSSKRYTKLLSGECDVITSPASSQIKQISEQDRVVLSSQTTGNAALIAFNTQLDRLKDARVRHALSNAIDLKTIRDAVFFETASATSHLLPRKSWAYNPRIAEIQFSPETSRAQLEMYKFDFSTPLRLVAPIKNSTFNPNFYKTAELIQSNLNDIGVKSEIIQLRNVELQNALLAGDYDFYITGISPYIEDPDNLFRPLLSCNANQLEGNTSQWCDPNMQTLLDETLLAVSFIQRVKNYYQLQHEIQQQRIYLPIAHLLRFDVFNHNISGLQVNPLTGINFTDVRKSPMLTKEETQ